MLRPVASAGARGLLGAALGITPDDPSYAGLRDAFLAHYEDKLCEHTVLFPGIADVIAAIAARGLAWGIVTNKVEGLAKPLVAQLPLPVAPGVVVGGDTTGRAKPDPLPLLYAAQQIGVAPERCLYVGDDRRDIDAGRAAGMATVAAGWGYCGATEPHDWRADHLTFSPLELLQLPGLRA